MRANLLILAFGILGGSCAFCDAPSDEQLRNAVLSEDLTSIQEWLQQAANGDVGTTDVDSVETDADAGEEPLAERIFFLAVKLHKPSVVRAMIQEGISPDQTQVSGSKSALYLAIESGDRAMVDTLLGAGADPVATGDSGDGSLAHQLWLALADHNNGFLELCLSEGLSPDYESPALENDSLVDVSIKVSNLDALRTLLDRNADITTVRMVNNYKTTLALAIQFHGERSEYLRLLKERGADQLKYTKAVPNVAKSTTDRLRIRKAPSLSGDIVGRLGKGDTVQILEVTPRAYTIDKMNAPWILIQKDSLRGWVFGGYLAGSEEYSGQSP